MLLVGLIRGFVCNQILINSRNQYWTDEKCRIRWYSPHDSRHWSLFHSLTPQQKEIESWLPISICSTVCGKATAQIYYKILWSSSTFRLFLCRARKSPSHNNKSHKSRSQQGKATSGPNLDWDRAYLCKMLGIWRTWQALSVST